MSTDSVYLVTLNYTSKNVGGASMVVRMMVDSLGNFINASVNGTFLNGSPDQRKFVGQGTGHVQATGFGNFTSIGIVTGRALVTPAGNGVGAYLSPFAASFAVDNNWTGTGLLSIGSQHYECQVATSKS